ncbi:hypothetical protein DPMN_049634 [Dreissena polymorpha]|uniref:Uncharacterized protein n=1 Tax=Dreissena polymorpha TaxID=45954 RepID=A0A9D4CFN8_DREPO|nr:hypothetical protein DPMN_049634 [Dreissena polymorpha]
MVSLLSSVSARCDAGRMKCSAQREQSDLLSWLPQRTSRPMLSTSVWPTSTYRYLEGPTTTTTPTWS